MTHSEKKLESLLLGLLYMLGTSAYRTKLVKLTYLIDESNYRLRGNTITGLTYIWDNFGPNAESNEIVKTLDRLASSGAILKHVGLTKYGSPTYRYSIEDSLNVADLTLTDGDWLVLRSAVHECKRMTVKQITQKSKNTLPVQRAGQYDTLQFIQDTSLTLTNEEISDDPFLLETLSAIGADDGERLTLDELRERIA